MNRRNFLIGSIGVGTLGGASVGTQTVWAKQQPSGTIVFEDQTTKGKTIVVEEISTDIDAILQVWNEDADDGLYRSSIEKGEYEDYEIELDRILTESAELSVRLLDQDGYGFAGDTALVEVDENAEQVEGFSPTLFEANPEAGFNYPYFLYAPSKLKSGDDRPILVEPNNTGIATDDFEEHKDAARRDIESSLIGRDVADRIQAPLLVPVFPRPVEEPVDGMHLVHQLDDDTMEIEDGPLERVDLQLINMVTHAQEHLQERGYSVDDSGMMLTGFSASGHFADRFTVLHPEEVISVTAGGLNGMALLPLEQADGHQLPYHVGIANVDELIGEEPDLDALSDTNQFLYMGAQDTNDTIPYDDAWTDEELRQLALDVYGEDMIDDRFPRCQELYNEAGVEAQFRIYPETGHDPWPARDDIVEFHERSITGKDVSHLGQDIIPNPAFEFSPPDPTLNHKVEFDASGTDPANKDILLFAWDLDDDETEIGEQVTHSFSGAGTYEVELTVVFDDGSKRSTSEEITIGEAGDGAPEVDFTISVSEPTTNDTIEFDSSDTDPAGKQIRVLAWDFDDGETETGVTVTHSYREAGTYGVQLTVIFGDGSQQSTSKTLTVDTTGPRAKTSQPGFGIVSALASIGGVAYLLKRRAGAEDGP